jgi:hypothetical protein
MQVALIRFLHGEKGLVKAMAAAISGGEEKSPFFLLIVFISSISVLGCLGSCSTMFLFFF